MENKYYIVNSVRLARALSYFGFDYYIFKNGNGTESYSFIDSKELRQAKRSLINLKKLYNNN